MLGSVIVKYDRSQSIHMPSRRDCCGLHRRVLGHAVAARAREAIEPVGLDLVLGVEPERLLDLDLDPQALAVEAVLVALILAQRRVVALEEVLQRPPPGVVDAHRVVRRDRPVDERERRPALVLAARRLLERAVAIPALEHGVLERDVVGLGRDGCECGIGGHGPFDRSRAPLAATAAGYADCPSRPPPALDATQTSRARARRRGSRRAASYRPLRSGPDGSSTELPALSGAARSSTALRSPSTPRRRCSRPSWPTTAPRAAPSRDGDREFGRLVGGLDRPQASITHSGGVAAGQADVAWGIDAPGPVRTVFAVDTGAVAGSRCNVSAGVFFWTSTDGGAELSRPAAGEHALQPELSGRAGDRGRVLRRQCGPRLRRLHEDRLCDRRLRRRTDGLAHLADLRGAGRLVPIAASGLTVRIGDVLSQPVAGRPAGRPRRRSPSATTRRRARRSEAQMCDLSISVAGHYCGAASTASVGPSDVLGDATAPTVASGVAGAADAERRRSRGTRDGGLARERGERRARVRGHVDGRRRELRPGPADRSVRRGQPGRPAARRDGARPRRRRLSLGSVGHRQSCRRPPHPPAPPLAGATTEAWAQPVVVQTAGAAPSSALPGLAAHSAAASASRRPTCRR